MKVTPAQPKPLRARAAEPRRTPRVAAVRRLEPDRPLRVWSLLLPPTLGPK
jgi:hypothetical protein